VINTVRYDPFSYRYPSRRNLVYGSKGMVAASNPLAASAGMEVLKKGGNAVDAAVATASALTVVEPISNGIGSDAFAIIWQDGRLWGLNGSGPAPSSFSIGKFHSLGYRESPPRFGWAASTVPGAPATWEALVSRMGRLPLSESLKPAISYARDGYAVSVNVSRFWKEALKIFSSLSSGAGDAHSGWFAAFCPDGRAPEPGERFRSPGHAYTLETIAAQGVESFYRGEIARKILEFSRRTGGFFTEGDLASFQPEWVEPISLNYRGYDVWELPPNGQGIVALQALGIISGFDFADHDSPAVPHRQIEAIKMAFADALRYVADPRFAEDPTARLLSNEHIKGRRRQIQDIAQDFNAGDPYSGGTVYLSAADADGCMVSYIQSNYRGFGAAVAIPDTGISLNNRAGCFSLDPEHPNALAPGKRPYNTIIPGFISKDGRPIGPFGVMGGYMQPQGHLQVVMNCVDFNMNPQEALDAPRWQWMGGLKVACEPGFENNTVQKLQRMGHEVSCAANPFGFGRGQIIWRTGHGTLVGATEPRTDGCVEAW
jgi:gamma-glutamyltranspeptidase/glutathione hydrolase